MGLALALALALSVALARAFKPRAFSPELSPKQVLAVQLDAARSLKELRELLADSYLEVFDVELLATKMVIEFEDQSGCFVRVVDSAPIRAGQLLTALSVHVTASVR